MRRTWTPEMEDALREGYAREGAPAMARALSEMTGREVTVRSVRMKAWRMGLASKTASSPYGRVERRVDWTREPEMSAWMAEHDKGRRMAVVSEEFRRRFGFRVTAMQISQWRARNGTASRRGHSVKADELPVGTERPGSDGYIVVKVRQRPDVPLSKDNWVPKQHVVWERAHGPVPEGSVVMFANGDMHDYSLDNLVAVPRRYMARINQTGYCDRESLERAVALAAIEVGINDAEHRMERTCAVCGNKFVEPPECRARGRRLQTCPTCIAAGRIAAGNRTGCAEEAVCAVCGRAFVRSRKGQRRCPDCIARMPKHSVESQLASEGRGAPKEP